MTNFIDVAIIGAGPAGMAAAVDAENNRLNFVLFENNKSGWYAEYSINQHYTIDGYLGAYNTTGTELVESFKKHLDSKGIRITPKKVEAVKKHEDNFVISCDDGSTYIARFLVIASGTTPKKLYLENYDKFFGKYIFNFVCKEDLDYTGKNVVVLGGRNSGATTAIFLANNTNANVTLIERDATLNATRKYLERLAKTRVKAITSATVFRINGEDKLESVDMVVGNQTVTIPCDYLFCSIGMKPNLKYLNGLEIATDSLGRIVVDPLTMESSIPNVYAIGDINQLLPKQVSNATANGKTAIYFINKKI